MVTATLFLAALGFIASLILAAASRFFYVWEDPRIEDLTNALPGANCGACGYPGCKASAKAISEKKAPVDICMVGGFAVASEIGKIMGVPVQVRESEIAKSGCTYGLDKAELIYNYVGIEDCRAAFLLYGGSKRCRIGCLGLGSCVKVCKFGALSMDAHHLPKVDPKRCTGCGACTKICPQNIITLTSTSRRITGEYTTDQCISPCMASCPAEIDIPGFILHIKNKAYEKAIELIREKCALPLVCGYICPAPCELNCNRNLIDQPVSIKLLKRFAADAAMNRSLLPKALPTPDKGIRIAVIGGGAEGLSLAYYLARLGYAPTLFEGRKELGGMLRHVIAGDRLPPKVLDHDIQHILDTGVKSRTAMIMGKNFTLASLFKEEFDMAVTTIGGADSRKILHFPPIPVQGLCFAHDLCDLKGKSVVVQGKDHGFSGLLTLCLEKGADKVIAVFNNPLETLPHDLQHMARFGEPQITIEPNAIITGLEGVSDHLTAVTLENSVLGEKKRIAAQGLVLQEMRIPELIFIKTSGEEDVPTWRSIESFRAFPFHSDLFSPPEPGRVSDAASVVNTILSARRLVRVIDLHYNGKKISPIKNRASLSKPMQTLTGLDKVSPCAREFPPVMDLEANSKTAWISHESYPGLDREKALKEAGRCLQCGLICHEKTSEKLESPNGSEPDHH